MLQTVVADNHINARIASDQQTPCGHAVASHSYRNPGGAANQKRFVADGARRRVVFDKVLLFAGAPVSAADDTRRKARGLQFADELDRDGSLARAADVDVADNDNGHRQFNRCSPSCPASCDGKVDKRKRVE